MLRKIKVIFMVAILMLVMGGCFDDDNASATQEPATSTTPSISAGSTNQPVATSENEPSSTSSTVEATTDEAVDTSFKINWDINAYTSKDMVDSGKPPFMDTYLFVEGQENENIFIGTYQGVFNASENVDIDVNGTTYKSLIGMYTWYGGGGDELYVYQKNERELAVVWRYLESPNGSKTAGFTSEFEEIMTIPIQNNTTYIAAEPVVENKDFVMSTYQPIVYDSLLLGGYDFNGGWVEPAETTEYIAGGEGYRCYKDGEYKGMYEGSAVAPDDGVGGPWTQQVEINYNDEDFSALSVNAPYSIETRKPTMQNVDNVLYEEYIAGILAENGLEDVPVYINQICRIDLENDGVEEVLISASNIYEYQGISENIQEDQYSMLVMRKLINGEVKTIFLEKDILDITTPVDWSERLIYEYTCVDFADLNYDGVLEVITKCQYYEGYGYYIYELSGEEMNLVTGNMFGA